MPRAVLTEQEAVRLTTRVQLRLTTIADNVEQVLLDLLKATEKVERLHRDDRFTANVGALRPMRPELDRVQEIVSRLSGDSRWRRDGQSLDGREAS